MCLSSANVKHDLGFNQCEANTIMLSFYIVLRSSGYSDHVVIHTEDTDVYIQADVYMMSLTLFALRKRSS